jgi:catechol 2,3-dioxygenase-like lactoylglutathione lyase family enzyme
LTKGNTVSAQKAALGAPDVGTADFAALVLVRSHAVSPLPARPDLKWSIPVMIESISAITLATHNMSRAVRFYRMLGFEIVHGGNDAAFTSFRAGTNYLNLIAQPAERNWSWWGRVVFYHSDVDSLHASVVAAGYRPDTAPRDAEWGERFFHLTDPDGHELSFAWPLR